MPAGRTAGSETFPLDKRAAEPITLRDYSKVWVTRKLNSDPGKIALENWRPLHAVIKTIPDILLDRHPEPVPDLLHVPVRPGQRRTHPRPRQRPEWRSNVGSESHRHQRSHGRYPPDADQCDRRLRLPCNAGRHLHAHL